MSEEVRAEAARLAFRLEVARQRLDAALASSPQPPAVPTMVDDDEVRALLTPAVDRVARLHDIARALADGTLSESSAAQAARALASTQPTRRPR